MAVSSDTKTVIIVDDEVNIVDLLVDILESADYNAIGCSVWTEAMDAISRESPDLVLLDLKMRTIDGPSMLEFIRGEGLDVPVIVVSGFVTEKVSEDMSSLGVSAFVGKPFRAAEILSQVEKVFAAAPPKPPTSMDALYADEGSEKGPEDTPTPQANNEVLAALEKLDSDPGPASPPDPQPASPNDEVLAALQKNEGPAPPSPKPSPAEPSSPVEPTPTAPKASAEPPQPPPTAASTPTTESAGNPGPATSPFADDLLGQPQNGTSNEEPRQLSVTGRRHHRPPPRRKRFTKRNILMFSAMFLICLAVAGVMAAMNWYADQIDVDALKKNTEKAITKQATQEILQQLKDSKLRP